MKRASNDPIQRRVDAMVQRLEGIRQSNRYHFNQPISELKGNGRIVAKGREMILMASYSYLSLIGHPRINAAAKRAIDTYGTGTHGVRFLAGTLPIHEELEERIAAFKGAEAAVTFSSGYVTNVATIASLLGRDDYVFSDKTNHASIVDGCLMSGAHHVRYRHNDMDALERKLQDVPPEAARLVVADGVFSMDGDVANLPKMAELCRKYGVWLMIDEAHSTGMLGQTGRGIEEHFDLYDAVDIKMGTLSKTIPSVGGYIAGRKELVDYIRHASRPYIMSAALPPAQAAAALEAFNVMEDEPWRVEKLQHNMRHFIRGLQERNFNTLDSETAVVPIICGEDNKAFDMTHQSVQRDVFALPVVSPAVPRGLARLRATVTTAHEIEDIERVMDVFREVGQQLGIVA